MTTTTKTIALTLFNAHNRGYGLGEFEYCIGSRLAELNDRLFDEFGIRLVMLVDPEGKGIFGDSVEYIALSKHDRKRLNNPIMRHFTKLRLPEFDIIHLTNQRPALRHVKASQTVMTVHDINFLHNDISPLRRWRKIMRTRRDLKIASKLTYISEFTRSDVETRFHPAAPAAVIHNGVTDLSDAHARKPESTVPQRFFFHISKMSRKKNVHLLIQMMKHLPKENLVLAGGGRKKYIDYLHRLVNDNGLTNIYFLGRVSAMEKAWLLANCQGLLFPSMSEGFGLPVVEAMCFGKPVFITRLTSLPEVGGKEAYYFDCLDPESMADTVMKGIADYNTDLQKASRIISHARQFNWDKAVEKYIRLYLDILH